MSLDAAIVTSVGDFNLDVEFSTGPGVTAVVGPNGAGKSTLLRSVAGLLTIEGRVVLEGVVLEDTREGVRVPTEERRAGIVWQDLLLFPHLDVLDNVAFGLRATGMDRRSARDLARSKLGTRALEHLGDRRPSELSRGEAQRVALLRALAPSPRLLLLDEPYSSLDYNARADARRAVGETLEGFEGITLLVTHDGRDALAFASNMIVIEEGRVVQSGSGSALASRPASSYVAGMAGLNFYRGIGRGTEVLVDGVWVAIAGTADGSTGLMIDPRAVAIYVERPVGTPRNVWRGRIVSIEPMGGRCRVAVEGEFDAVAEITERATTSLGLVAGSDVWISVKATEVEFYPL